MSYNLLSLQDSLTSFHFRCLPVWLKPRPSTTPLPYLLRLCTLGFSGLVFFFLRNFREGDTLPCFSKMALLLGLKPLPSPV